MGRTVSTSLVVEPGWAGFSIVAVSVIGITIGFGKAAA